MREWFSVQAAAAAVGGKKGGGEILIFSHIGKRWWDDKDSVEVKAFVEALNGMVKAGPGDITVRINSPGGDVGAGMTIYNSLRAVKNRVVCRVEGYAYSMASVIALAGRETQMADVAQFMVHNPTTGAWGGKKEMERAIAALETATATLVKAYSKKTGKTAAEIEALMEETTFMTAEEAKEFGFVDVILDGEEVVEGAVAACFDASAWAAYYQGVGELPRGEEGLAADAVEESGRSGKSDVLESGESQAGMPAPLNGGAAPKESMVMKISDIKKACPGASAEFVNAQMEACEANDALTLSDVQTAFIAHQAEALASAQADAAAARAEGAKKTPAVPPVAGPQAAGGIGVKPLGMGASAGPEEDDGGVDPHAAWAEAVEAQEKRGKTRAQAVRAVAVGKPDLHRAYLSAYNQERGHPA